jgi:EAL and modified HD-GYP domain-containing signal transduction protein
MKTLIVAIPFFNSDMSVEAYRLCSRSGQKLLGMLDDYISPWDAVLSPGLDLVKTLGLEPLTGGCPLFVDINEYHLLMGVPLTLGIEPDKLVCVLPNSVKPDEPIIAKCRELKDLGYSIAIDGFLEGNTRNPLFELIDYIIVDTHNCILDKTYKDAIKSQAADKRIVLSSISDMDRFHSLSDLSNTLFSGGFFNQPITKGASVISPIKINALTLLKQLNEDDFDLSDIAGTIERDPSLSISLMKFINTVMPRKINSIRNAVAILGQKEVKRWATAALSIQLAEDRPSEITKLSLIRARFAENLAKAFDMAIFAPSLFMLGLFSLLDVILEKPIEDAVKEVALDEKIKEALVDNTGDFYKVLDFMYVYEHANWDAVAIKMVQYNLELDDITTAFIEALNWYKALLNAIGSEDEGE